MPFIYSCNNGPLQVINAEMSPEECTFSFAHLFILNAATVQCDAVGVEQVEQVDQHNT